MEGRIKKKDKAKILAPVWGDGIDSIPCRTGYCAPGWFLKKRMNRRIGTWRNGCVEKLMIIRLTPYQTTTLPKWMFSLNFFFFKSFLLVGHSSSSCQPAATTFSFSSFFFLLLCITSSVEWFWCAGTTRCIAPPPWWWAGRSRYPSPGARYQHQSRKDCGLLFPFIKKNTVRYDAIAHFCAFSNSYLDPYLNVPFLSFFVFCLKLKVCENQRKFP